MRLELEGFLKSISPIMLREVGHLLTETCKDRLDQRQREIAAAISRVEKEYAKLDVTAAAPESQAAWSSSGASSGTPVTRSTGESLSRPKGGRIDTVDAALVANVSSSTERRSGRRKRSGLIAFALLAAAAAGAWVLRDRIAPHDPLPVTATTPAAAPISKHRLAIHAKPAGARVLVDDALVIGNPAVVSVPHGSSHSVRLELEGYESSERTIVVEGDLSLTIELAAETAPAAASADEPDADSARSKKIRGRNVRVFTPPPVKSAAAPAGEDKCKPPYYFVEGIKTYKPECI
jgi:hypothetical protein